jgi:hypothetical protein
MWCGVGHLHKECPEKGSAASIQTCCNCSLVDGEEPHPSSYQGCSNAREEMWKRKSQREPMTAMGKVFSSSHTTPGLSYMVMLHSNTQQQQQPQPQPPWVAQACLASLEAQPTMSTESVQAPTVNSSSLNDMFSVVNNSISADHGRAQWGWVIRRQNSSHHKNYIRSHEAKWLIEFIGSSKL